MLPGVTGYLLVLKSVLEQEFCEDFLPIQKYTWHSFSFVNIVSSSHGPSIRLAIHFDRTREIGGYEVSMATFAKFYVSLVKLLEKGGVVEHQSFAGKFGSIWTRIFLNV